MERAVSFSSIRIYSSVAAFRQRYIMSNNRLLWQLHPTAYCRSELAFFSSAAEKRCSSRLALLLLLLCRVSVAMLRGESKLQFLLARGHKLGFGHRKITKVGRDL